MIPQVFFFELIPGSFKSNRPINIAGINKVHPKCDRNNGSVVNGTREPFLYSFGLDQPPDHKIYKDRKIKLFKKVNKYAK